MAISLLALLQPLMEAGLDSLGTIELRNALNARFALDMPATLVFDHPTIASLAQHVARELQGIDSGVSYGPVGRQWLQTSPRSERTRDAKQECCVVGLSSRFPSRREHATGMKGFWQGMTVDSDVQRLVPLQRWDVDASYAPMSEPGRPSIYVRCVPSKCA